MNDWRSWVVLLVAMASLVIAALVGIAALARTLLELAQRGRDDRRIPRAIARATARQRRLP